jgi:hypothetical protein
MRSPHNEQRLEIVIWISPTQIFYQNQKAPATHRGVHHLPQSEYQSSSDPMFPLCSVSASSAAFGVRPEFPEGFLLASEQPAGLYDRAVPRKFRLRRKLVTLADVGRLKHKNLLMGRSAPGTAQFRRNLVPKAKSW